MSKAESGQSHDANRIWLVAWFVAVLLTLALALLPPTVSAGPQDQLGGYIVVFKDSVSAPASLAKTQTENRDAELGFVYRHATKGYSAELTKREVEGLRKDSRVKFVTLDHKLRLFAQSNPTGIDRVFAPENGHLDIDEEDDVRVDADVAVIDTGIAEHEDLNVVGYIDCQTKVTECKDGVKGTSGSHGTHVAGTVGALDNGKGVVGVAPGVRLWSVRVELGAVSLETFESSAMAGVDWVAATRTDEDHENDIDVANMSFGCFEFGFFGCPKGLPALDGAISSAVEEGVVMVAAAGNESGNALFAHPASHPDVITVSALADYDGKAGGEASPTCKNNGSDDKLASFSNYGATVEVAAPGVCILSTVPGGYEGGWSGTSMASPHVAGAAAILAAEEKPKSAEDVEAIRDTIIEEGNLGWEDTSPDEIQEPLLDVGNEEVFGGKTPKVASEGAVEVTLTEALLRGKVNPNGFEAKYHFEYGTTTKYDTSVPIPAKAIGSGTKDVSVSEAIEGLEPHTTYHFRLVATNEEGSRASKDMTFTTAPGEGVQIEAPTGITTEGATLHGTVDPEGLETEYHFEYGTTTEYGDSVPVPAKGIGSGIEAIEVEEILEGLEPETTYHVRLVATSKEAEEEPWVRYSKDRTFTTIPLPVVQTKAATGVGKKGATLNGTVDPEGFETSYKFEYGKTTLYGASVPASFKKIGEGTEAVEVKEAVEGLEAGTTYHFRLVAFNGGGTTKGKDMTFTTASPTPPAVQTEAATTGTSGKKATLRGTVNPEEFETTYQFEYGKTTSYGTNVPVPVEGVGSGAKDVKVSQPIAGLEPETTYHFRLVATNAWGTTKGKDVTVTTPPLALPIAETKPATDATNEEATLHGFVETGGLDADYHFEYGKTTAYGTSAPVPAETIEGELEELAVEEALEGLEPETVYHYRLVATNGDGTSHGEDMTFATGEPVTFVANEEPMEVPNEILGVSTSMEISTGTQLSLCNKVEFTGELTHHKVGPATLESLDVPDFKCYIQQGGGGSHYYEFIGVELSSIHFLADGTAHYEIDSGTMKMSFWGGTCSISGSNGANSWSSGSSSVLAAYEVLEISGGGCPSTMAMEGSFTLTLTDETPVEIAAE